MPLFTNLEVGARVPRLGIFCQLGFFWRLNVIFLEKWNSSKKWQHFGQPFAVTKLLHFYLNKLFQNMACCRYFKVSKVTKNVDALEFQIELCCRYFVLFSGLETFWATFWKIGQILIRFFWGSIFSHVRPFFERAVSDLDRSMHISLWISVTPSSFIEGSHMTKNTASGQPGWCMGFKDWL